MRRTWFLPILSAAMVAAAPAFADNCFEDFGAGEVAGAATAVAGPDVGVQQGGRGGFSRPDTGDDILNEDRVRTGAASRLQVRFCDYSTYTFSPDSEAWISDVYDADDARRRRNVNYVRGGMRYGSGRGGDGSTEVEIERAGVTMGVRGTNVLIVEIDGVIYALLEGPSKDNTGLAPRGRVEFWKGSAPDQILAKLTRPGYAVIIGPDGVSEPFRADHRLLERIYAAFSPAPPPGSDAPRLFERNPLLASGESGQRGAFWLRYENDRARWNADEVESRPEQPSEGGIDPDDRYEEAFPIQVGDVLPLAELEAFADVQPTPDGHVLALVPAVFVGLDGEEEQGLALIQLGFDYATGTIAPDATASFIKLDFAAPFAIGSASSSGAGALAAAFRAAMADSLGIPFSSGENGFAIYATEAFTLIIRRAENDGASVDVGIDFSADGGDGAVLKAFAEALDLEFGQGPGPLIAFDFNLTRIAAIESLAGVTGATTLFGYTGAVSGAPDAGFAYGQVHVDFGARRIGGGDSFLLFWSGVSSPAYQTLSQTASFDAGLFGLALFPLAALADPGPLLGGQALIGDDGEWFYGAVAALMNGGGPLGAEFLLDGQFGGYPTKLASMAALEGLGGAFGETTLYFDGYEYGASYATLVDAQGLRSYGAVSAGINIDFAARTLGGGGSHVRVDFYNPGGPAAFQGFYAAMNEMPFGAAIAGKGLFALGPDAFSDSYIDALLLMLREGVQGAAIDTADIFFRFNDGAGGEGLGELIGMELVVPDIRCQYCDY